MEEHQVRRNYKDIQYSPAVFFVIFGVSGESLQISRSRHHVDAFPEDLQLYSLSRERNREYIDSFFRGDMGSTLHDSDPEVFKKCRAAEDCVVIQGQVREDADFDYMRNLIGIIQALSEQGAAGILDLLTFSLISPQSWTERFFEKEINAQNHVVILFSEEEGGYWLHTRGLSEFGRPDLSLHEAGEAQLEEYKAILDQMIFYSGEGVFFDGEFKLHTFSGSTYKVVSRFVDDFENDDFNNAYCEVTVLERLE